MILREYQKEAVEAVVKSQVKKPCIVLPTGAGKTPVIAELIKEFSGKRILVLTHRKELLSQNEAHIGGASVLVQG